MKTFTTYEPVQGMSLCKKKPVLVKCKQINEPFEIITMEGKMQGKPGDYLICGVEGELYVCDQAIFNKTYDLV